MDSQTLDGLLAMAATTIATAELIGMEVSKLSAEALDGLAVDTELEYEDFWFTRMAEGWVYKSHTKLLTTAEMLTAMNGAPYVIASLPNAPSATEVEFARGLLALAKEIRALRALAGAVSELDDARADEDDERAETAWEALLVALRAVEPS